MSLWNSCLAAHIAEQRVASCIPTAHRTSPHLVTQINYTPYLDYTVRDANAINRRCSRPLCGYRSL
jgi:hypothetical protein